MKGKTALPDPFPITDAMREWADTKVPTLDVDYYHDEFCDHWWSNGKQMVNWVATWRNWMRRTDNGSAPGMYGREDRSIRRKRPRAVPQEQMTLQPPTPIEQYLEKKDRAYAAAIAAGMPMPQARTASLQDLEAYTAKDGDHERAKRI